MIAWAIDRCVSVAAIPFVLLFCSPKVVSGDPQKLSRSKESLATMSGIPDLDFSPVRDEGCMSRFTSATISSAVMGGLYGAVVSVWKVRAASM